MTKQFMDELRLAQLLSQDVLDDKKLEILKDLDVTCTISGKPSTFQEESAFLGYNCLHIAAIKSDLDLTQKLLNLGANLLQQGVQDGKTPLRKAIEFVQNNSDKPVLELMGVLKEQHLVNTLLSAQMMSNNPFNARCKSGISHLHIACMFNHAEAVLFFTKFNESVDQKVNVDSNRLPGYTPLHCAIRYSSSETAAILLTLGADIYLKDAQGRSSVSYLIERLLDMNDNLRMSDGYNGYLYEKEIDRLDSIVKVIIMKNKTDDSKLVENTGLSTFHLACAIKDNWIMQLYFTWNFKDVNKPVSCQSKLWAGWTPLHFAVCCNIQTFKVLLNNRADIMIKNAKGETAFDLGLRRYSPEILLSYASINTMLSDKSTKLSDLMLAIINCSTYKEFLRKLKDINMIVPLESPVCPGYNLLHMSISTIHRMKCSEIFRQETDSYAKFEINYDALLKNLTQTNDSLYWEKFEMSLEKGCSVYAKNADGLTPIHLAFKLEEWHVLDELLIRAHENIIAPDNVSFLHIACVMGKEDVVEHLLEQGADVNSPLTSSFEWHRKPKSYSEMSNQNKVRKESIRANSTLLHIAVLFKMEGVVEKLLKKHADIHAEDDLGLTPLHLALASTKSIAQLLLNGPLNLKDVKREDGLSHLHVASFADDEKAVEKLLQDGADVNGFIKNTVPNCLAAFVGKTPLHFAVEGSKVARVLIEKKANFTAENPYRNYETPLDLAMRKLCSSSSESKFPFEKLKSKRIRVDALTTSGLTTLHIACATLDLKWAWKLIKRGADSNAQMNDGQGRVNTPMHLLIANTASTRSLPENFKLLIIILLKSGADVNISNNCRTPLLLLANVHFGEKFQLHSFTDKRNLLTIAYCMLSNQSSYAFNPTDCDGFSHFHFSCIVDNLAVIKKYLDNGVDINYPKSPFAEKNHYPIPYNYSADKDFARSRLERWDVVRAKDKNGKSSGFTPLHFAIMHGNTDVARLLLERGANVTAEDTNGNTPLHLAIIKDLIDLQLFDELLRKGADINAKNLRNETPFACFLYHQNITYEQFHFFINRGSLIDITEPIRNEQGIMGSTMRNIHPSDVKLVFEKYLELTNVKDAINKGFRAIHNIVSVRESGNLTRVLYANIIQKLMKIGSDIEETDMKGKTAFHAALLFENLKAIEALLLLGANVNVDETMCNCACIDRAYKSSYFMRNHLWKMSLVNLDLNASNLKVTKDETLQPDNNDVQLHQLELDKTKNTKICQSITVKHFLSEWGAVIEYPIMSVAERLAVDNFFKRTNELRKEFPKFAGLLSMQYRKALARVRLMQPVRDILIEAGIDLPDLCLEAILRYFKNSELNFWIEKADEESTSSELQKIE